jgi:uncharacterized protein (TIGR00661 family)
MKFLFLVQGEGRGHMTQAIELASILSKNGHEVTHTFIGVSKRRKVPDYFYEQMPTEVSSLQSPNFILDKQNRSLNLSKSITYNARFLLAYKKGLDLIHKKVKTTQAEVVVNFYDFLGGFYFQFYRPSGVRHVCIGRQFLTYHPDYLFEPGRDMEKKLYLLNNRLTSQRCDKYLALSFRLYEPQKVGKMVVVPPLIKSATKQVTPTNGGYVLGYMVNDGYAEDFIDQHKKNPEQEMHCFWDRKNMPKSYSPHANLTFHQIDNELFTQYMQNCKGYISTAGFESICEAMYLGKPALMIPVDGQYEQACNAIDAEISGAGKRAESFDIGLLLSAINQYRTNEDFKAWVARDESIFIDELTNL